MKSTYKILNTYLDGQELPEQDPRIFDATEASECCELEEGVNIFDFPVCRRKMSGMKLLSFHSELDVLNLIGRLPDCRELVILLDYNSAAKTARDLFLKRVLQSASLIMKQYPGMTITFVGDNRDRNTIKQLYKSRKYHSKDTAP
ncbi:MAG: hypothetical protein HUJ72_00450 [Blautia sp.]|nr:hypothetical protein [Blautia sp.]